MASQSEADSHYYYDPLYGSVVLRPVLRSAINLGAMQRLRYLKQLDVLDMVFPGATHTRFAHSVGVFKITSEIINHLLELQFAGSETEWPPIRVPHVLATQLAALFHDVGRGPLSAIFDLFCRYSGYRAWDHENVTKKLITEGFGEFNEIPQFLDELLHSVQSRGIRGDLDFLRPDTIASISQGLPPPADPRYLFLSQIVSSSIDADRIDYLARDAFHTLGETNLVHREQIIDNVTISRETLGDMQTFALRVNEEGAMGVEALLSARELMYRRVYFNRTHRGNQELLIRAFREIASTYSPEDLVMKTDTEIFELLALHNSLTRNVARRLMRGSPYVHLPFDIQVHRDLGEVGRERWAELRSLRRDEVFAAEKHLASKLGLESETVVFVLDEPPLTLKSDYFGTHLYDPDTGQSMALVDVLPHLLLTRGSISGPSDRPDAMIDLGRTYLDMFSYVDTFVPSELPLRVAEAVNRTIEQLPNRPSKSEISELVRKELDNETCPLRIVFNGILDLLQFPTHGRDREPLWNRCLPSLSRQVEELVRIEPHGRGKELGRVPFLTQQVDRGRPQGETQDTFERNQLASKIIGLLNISNLMLERLIPGFYLFRSDMEVANELHTPCTNQNDFRMKIGAISNLFDVRTDALRKILKNPKEEWKSVRMIEEWMTQVGVQDWNHVTVVWKKIIDLRNASFPYHPTDSKFVDLVKYFGGSFPVHYPDLWLGVLRKFHQSLNGWQRLLGSFS